MFEETQHGLVTVVTEWRVVEDFPGYEINRDGILRKRKSRRVIKTQNGGADRFRYVEEGVRRSIPTKKLRNRAFPELGAW